MPERCQSGTAIKLPSLDETNRDSLLQHATTECVKTEFIRIGNIVNVWRLRKEPLRHFSHRIALTLQEEICNRENEIADREALLAIVLSLQKHPSCNSRDQSHDQ